jgi:hypothetical protein
MIVLQTVADQFLGYLPADQLTRSRSFDDTVPRRQVRVFYALLNIV